MTIEGGKLVIDYPRRHTLDQLRPLYEEFVRQNPDLREHWIDLEKGIKKNEGDDLSEIINRAHSFLKKKADVRSTSGLVSAAADFRKLFVKDYVEY